LLKRIIFGHPLIQLVKFSVFDISLLSI
jgi:hypothetical protein